MSEQTCRWGILGAAVIAKKNWLAIRNTGNACVTAVASRSVERANQFIDECMHDRIIDQRPAAVDTYDELIARDDVDAVYIPLPTGVRKEWVIKAANAGKHVMCEKPCAPNAHDLADMVAACNNNNVQFMDGVMYMHSKRLDAMRSRLDAGDIGDIKRIVAQFSFNGGDEFLSENIRVNSSLEPQGCLGDLGWYTIRFALWAMNWQLPKAVTGRIISEHGSAGSPGSVPTEFSGELFFDGGVSAGFYNSFLTDHQQLGHISGTKGNLSLNDFVLPFHGNQPEFEVSNAAFTVSGCDFIMERHTTKHTLSEYSQSAPNAQETNLFRKFSELALSGKPDAHWPDLSLKTQRIMDACLESARADSKLVELG